MSDTPPAARWYVPDWSAGDGTRLLHALLPDAGMILVGTPDRPPDGQRRYRWNEPAAWWHVNIVQPLPKAEWTAAELAAWRDAGRPVDWPHRPARLHLTSLPDGPQTSVVIRPHGYRYREWQVVHDTHRPLCAGCGQPFPCRHLQHEIATARAERARAEQVAILAAGRCWACREDITERQKWTSYPGRHLDVAGGPAPRFHTGRAACRHGAAEYEKRWAGRHPGRRTVQHVSCTGWLRTHVDGSQDCTSPSCPGLDAGHGRHMACHAGDEPPMTGHLAGVGPGGTGPCPRGCPADGHPGALGRDRARARHALVVKARKREEETGPVYVVPAAFPLIAVHVQDPDRPGPRNRPRQRGLRVAEWPRETVVGWTRCSLPMYAEGLWTRYDYDPDRDGPQLWCHGCGGPEPAGRPAEEVALPLA